MWSGTREEYYELYVTASKHLKTCFPNLKIGGYGSCGFYAVTRPGMSDFYQSFVPYFTDFLDCVKENGAPLDFFSWHIYNGDPEEVLAHAVYVRRTLDEKGFKDTQSSLNEWNYGAEGSSHVEKKTMEGASYVAAVMAGLQNSGLVDTAMYYVASLLGVYNGLFRAEDKKYMKPFYALCAWGQLWSLGTWHKPAMEAGKGLYCCAASGEKEAGVLLSNIGTEEVSMELQMDGLSGVTAKFYLLDEHGDMEITKTEIFRGDTVIPVVKMGARTVMYVALTKD